MAWAFSKNKKPKELKPLPKLSDDFPDLPEPPKDIELPKAVAAKVANKPFFSIAPKAKTPEKPKPVFKQAPKPFFAPKPAKHAFFSAAPKIKTPEKPKTVPLPKPRKPFFSFSKPKPLAQPKPKHAFFAPKPVPLPKPAEIKHEARPLVINKNVDDIKELHRRHKELSSSIESHGKNLTILEKEFDEHRNEMLDEIKAINKNLGPLYDKDVHLEEDLCSLTKAGKEIVSEVEKISRKVKDIKDIVLNVEGAYSPENMKIIVDQIRQVISSVRAIENKDTNTVDILQRVDRRIGVVEKHSQVIDAERAEMKASADALAQHASELKETVGGYARQLVDMSSKISANIAKTADIDEHVRGIMRRTESIEGQLVAAEKLSQILQEHSRLVTEIAKRLDYLEKATVKTMILD